MAQKNIPSVSLECRLAHRYPDVAVTHAEMVPMMDGHLRQIVYFDGAPDTLTDSGLLTSGQYEALKASRKDQRKRAPTTEFGDQLDICISSEEGWVKLHVFTETLWPDAHDDETARRTDSERLRAQVARLLSQFTVRSIGGLRS